MSGLRHHLVETKKESYDSWLAYRRALGELLVVAPQSPIPDMLNFPTLSTIMEMAMNEKDITNDEYVWAICELQALKQLCELRTQSMKEEVTKRKLV